MARREESEKVSELKSISGSGKLPYGTLVLGTEGIKDAISGFEDAYVPVLFFFLHSLGVHPILLPPS